MKKIFVSLSPIILFVLLINQCASTPAQKINALPQELQAPVSVSFLHWNDFHSANIPYTSNWGYTKGLQIGGYATLAGYLDSLKLLYSGAIVLNAGDDFQGSPISALTKGMSQIRILNEIKPTAFTIGNHEFDYGKDNLQKAV
ncbi:hypothetical protein KKC74_07165, partial [bacterium]|nr:hypothetical protein [bacterium]